MFFSMTHSYRRWSTLCGLLVIVLVSCLIVDATAAGIRINIPERDIPWPWKPQLADDLPPSLFTGEVKLSKVDQWRILSYVGAPFSIASDSSFDLMQIVELVHFMRADGLGQCPCYSTPVRAVYFWFHPAELELLYGNERWAALQRLREPTAWSRVLHDDVGPDVRDAEAFIAQLAEVDPPGQLLLHIHGGGGAENGAGDVWVSLADFRVKVRLILAGSAMEVRLPRLTVESEASGRRHHLHHFLKVKQQARAVVAQFDAATVEAQRSLQDALMELRQEEQKAYDAQAGFKQRYRQFLLERQSRRVMEGQHKNESATASPSELVFDVASAVGVRIAAPLARTSAQQHAVACQKVTAAWQTLVHGGVRWESDQRARQLRRLFARHACPGELTPLQPLELEDEEDIYYDAKEEKRREEVARQGSDVDHSATEKMKAEMRTEEELSVAASEVWAMSVAEMLAQEEKSGRPPTFAQLYAVLFAVWQAEVSATAAEKDGEANATAFVKFVDRFVESGDAAEMAGGWLPRFVRAEVHYLVGILDIVTHYHDAHRDSAMPEVSTSLVNITRTTTTPVRPEASESLFTTKLASGYGDRHGAGGVVRGVVHLHQALSAGSHHAAGALATLREHGIFLRQHSKAAMLLLLRSMTAAPTYLLRELLLTPRAEAETVAAADSRRGLARGDTAENDAAAVVDAPVEASRLLRFERPFAVAHSIREVDSPYLTRDVARMLVAVSSENVQSNDDAPELEDVYREADEEREDEYFVGKISERLHRRVTKAKVLFSGFKDVPSDPGEAQCELLVVLRQLGFFCDLDPQWVLTAARSSSGWRARHKAPETRIGVPLPDTCAEHHTEFYSVLGNTQHTILRCRHNGKEATPASDELAVLLGHRHLPVPNSASLFSMLQETLLALSYLHLIHTRQYELSHLYAALAVEASLRVQQLLMTKLATVHHNSQFFMRAIVASMQKGNNTNATTAADDAKAAPTTVPTVSLHEILRGTSEGDGVLAWAAELMVEEIEDGAEDDNTTSADAYTASLTARTHRMVERCRSVADSPFLETEALLLLALSRWAQRDRPLVGDLVTPLELEKKLSQWSMEPFRFLGELLRANDTESGKKSTSAAEEEDALRELRPVQHDTTVNTSPLQEGGRRNKSTKRLAHAKDPLDVHALFLICLVAMKRRPIDRDKPYVLDSTTFSMHLSDPFVLAAALLRMRDPTTAAGTTPLISLTKLRKLAFAAAPHLLGRTPHLLPVVDDTVESYAARLLRYATRHTEPLAPTMELLRSGIYGLRQPGAEGGRQRAIVDDAPPRRYRLRMLRHAKQYALEASDLQPLLYAADAHDYYNRSRWTYLGTALSAAYNALLYPFTYTTSESVLVEMEARLQLIAPEARKDVVRKYLQYNASSAAEDGAAHGSQAPTDGRSVPSLYTQAMEAAAGEETTSVTPFIDAFAKDVRLREHFLACQLFSFALDSGMPEGFSLMFYEAADRGNPFLRTLVDYLANAVFGRWTASLWTEHHLSAEWQREKKELRLDGSMFTLNPRSPFRYAALEGRQELFARLSRWKAAKALAAAAASASVNASSCGVAAARDELLWCAGLLTREAYHGSGQVYPLAYEGALYPAADLECVAELNALFASSAAVDGTTCAGARFATAPAAAGSSGEPRRGARWTKAQRRQAQVNGTALLRDLGDRLGYVYDLIEKPPERRLPLSESEFRLNTTDLEIAIKRADVAQQDRKQFLRASAQLVEPWNRRTYDYNHKALGYGEGAYYNRRLHRVSGYRWGSRLQSWWLRVRHFFP